MRYCREHEQRLKDGKKIAWPLRPKLLLLPDRTDKASACGVFGDVLAPVLNRLRPKSMATIEDKVRIRLPDVPEDNLFSIIKGTVFKCTVARDKYGPRVVALKVVERE